MARAQGVGTSSGGCIWPNQKGGKFQIVPHDFLDYQADLELTDSELVLILKVLRFKYTSDHPFPSNKRLAKSAGCTEKQIRRIKGALRAKGYLHVISRVSKRSGNKSTAWNFDPLIECFLALKAKKKAENSLAKADENVRTGGRKCPYPPVGAVRRRRRRE